MGGDGEGKVGGEGEVSGARASVEEVGGLENVVGGMGWGMRE